MRGKEALAAANARTKAAQERIEALTAELADAKARARAAEAKAARLEGADLAAAAANRRNDEMLKQALESLALWKQEAKADEKRRHAAIDEVLGKLLVDLKAPPQAGESDRSQFLRTRYPCLVRALLADDNAADHPDLPRRISHAPWSPAERKLSGEDLRRFQKLTGSRATVDDGRDLAAVWDDALTVAREHLDLEGRAV